jgi:hypothetical protein
MARMRLRIGDYEISAPERLGVDAAQSARS